MKRTYLPNELPQDKKECMNVLLSGCTIKNPYVEELKPLWRLERAIYVLNDLVSKKDPLLPTDFKTKIVFPKRLDEVIRTLEEKAKNWKL